MALDASGIGHPAIKVDPMPGNQGPQAASGNSGPSSHRPAWCLALMGPSTTGDLHHVDPLGPWSRWAPRSQGAFITSTTLVPVADRSLVVLRPQAPPPPLWSMRHDPQLADLARRPMDLVP